MNVADWTSASRATALASLERHLRCLACNGPVEKALMVLGSLRCLACRDVDAPLDPALFDEMLPKGNAALRDRSPELASE
jgi:hypothetical protein